MESFNRGEHVIAAFLDVEKAFDNVWHNGLRYKIYQLDLPTKLCRWLSDFLVGRVIQVKIEGFLSPKVYPKAGVPHHHHHNLFNTLRVYTLKNLKLKSTRNPKYS